MTSYAINIVGTVPVVAYVKDGTLFCNAPNGYVLWLVAADGSKTKLDERDTSVIKPFVFDVPEGSRLELDPKGDAP